MVWKKLVTCWEWPMVTKRHHQPQTRNPEFLSASEETWRMSLDNVPTLKVMITIHLTLWDPNWNNQMKHLWMCRKTEGGDQDSQIHETWHGTTRKVENRAYSKIVGTDSTLHDRVANPSICVSYCNVECDINNNGRVSTVKELKWRTSWYNQGIQTCYRKKLNILSF